MAQDGINIVWNSLEGDKILDRLARLLAERTGWPLSIRPTGHALINYDMNYIDFAQRFSDWRKTPWAAYFSHYEADNYHKQMWWEMAIPLVDIQTVTANQYGNMCPNPMKVIPPVEARFEIRERKAHDKPVLGVSGFVCPGGRKGENLLSRLAMELEGRMEFTAHGVGWPVKMEKGGLDNLVEFYNRLDAYVCTSLIEGIPMPPLEALRCGIPVIIPRGVGMLDELPDMEGIWRYEAGDYEDLRKVVEDFNANEANWANDANEEFRIGLREAAGGYTEEAWVTSHMKGFERMLKAEGKAIDTKANYSGMTTDRHGQRGVYYVAFGKPAIRCAAAAIRSFREHLPDIPTAVASERPNRSNGAYKQMKEEDFKELQGLFEEMVSQADYFIECKDEDIGGRAAKVRIDELAPKEWTYIAYLDADTEITAGEDFLWRLVEDGWDMAICKNPSRFHIASQMRRSDNKDECEETFRMLGTDQLIQLNGGVFCYQRNERTRAFFQCWQEEWRRHGKRDQAALLRSLFMHPLKLYVLGNEWNTITRYDAAETAAWLLHYPMTARRWRGVVHYRLDDPQAWNAVREFERAGK